MATNIIAEKGKSGSALHRAYESIHQDLLAGAFEPGEKLRIEDVCDRYGVGISPVREALSRLSETGLIVALPQRGYRVATVSTEEYADLVQMRLKLEPDALYRSIRNADIEWEAGIASAYQRLRGAQKLIEEGSPEGPRIWAQEDRQFHGALVANCGSPWLINFCRILHEQTARYHRMRIVEGITPTNHTEAEHAQLMCAAIDHKADAGADLLRKHIRNVADRISSCLTELDAGQ